MVEFRIERHSHVKLKASSMHYRELRPSD